MNLIYWIIVGGLAGWIASMIMKTDAQMGAIANIVVGIVGALIGGWVLSALLGFKSTDTVGNIIVAIVGAVILLGIWKALSGRRPAA